MCVLQIFLWRVSNPSTSFVSLLAGFEVPFAIALFSVKLSSSGSWSPLPTLPSCFELHRMFLLSVWLQVFVAGLDLPTPCVPIPLCPYSLVFILPCYYQYRPPSLCVAHLKLARPLYFSIVNHS